MLDNYVFKLRRDFSSVLVPSRLFAPQFKRKKQNTLRAYDDFGYYTSAHALDCDCIDCIADKPVDNTPALNDSENGYLIRSRSKLAIRNAANSIFYRCDNKERLRFITFTFPPLPEKQPDKRSEDKFLHKLFKKFLDNERKNYGLKMWLWTNERQSGDRLEDHERTAREVLHYHCIFDYEDTINYYLVNLRFLRLLHRNNFNILSSNALRVKKSSFQYAELKKACQAIAKGDYKYLVNDTERMYIRDELGIKRFIFLCPVDFEKIRYESMDITKLSCYISKYISKSSDKVYCRRWGCSHGLVITDEQLMQFCKDTFPEDYVNPDTGEIISCVNQSHLMQFLTMGEETTPVIKFDVEIGGQTETIYYFSSNWAKWSKHSAIRQKFLKYFNYRI